MRLRDFLSIICRTVFILCVLMCLTSCGPNDGKEISNSDDYVQKMLDARLSATDTTTLSVNNQNVFFGKNIVVFGDSIAWGQSSYLPSVSKNAWPEMLEQLTGANVYNLSIPGSALAYIYDDPEMKDNKRSFVNFVDDIDFKQFDYCMIAFGTNDLSYKIPIITSDQYDKHSFLGALNYCINTILASNSNCKIILITPLVDYRNDDTYIKALVEYGYENDISCVDMRGLGINTDDFFDVYWDHKMHPIDNLYYAMACYISCYPNSDSSQCHRITYDVLEGHMNYILSENEWHNSAESLVIDGFPIGDMPIALRTGYVFDGWFTEEMGGIEVEPNSSYTLENDITLYAHYTPIE